MTINSDIFSLDATLIAEVIVFALVALVVARFVLPPLRAAMTERQTKLEKGLADAANAELLVAKAEADYQTTLAEARRQGAEILAHYRRMAIDIETDAKQRASQTTERLVRNANNGTGRRQSHT